MIAKNPRLAAGFLCLVGLFSGLALRSNTVSVWRCDATSALPGDIIKVMQGQEVPVYGKFEPRHAAPIAGQTSPTMCTKKAARHADSPTSRVALMQGYGRSFNEFGYARRRVRKARRETKKWMLAVALASCTLPLINRKRAMDHHQTMTTRFQ